VGLSVLTLARGRRPHLQRLIEGLCRSELAPNELIIVDMGGPAIEYPAAPFPIRLLALSDSHLPLAQARNLAASEARHEFLLFLDVDCIPMAGLLGSICCILEKHNGLLCAEIYYLSETAIHEKWEEATLLRDSKTHQARAFPTTGTRVERNPGLFWSLAFAVRRALFQNLGGFDERFTGYGAEDTDFSFRAHQSGVELLFLGGAGAFHQYHETYEPPLQHFEDIVRNAGTFFKIWGFWPMKGWLGSFEQLGLIRLRDNKIITIRSPNASEIEMARSHTAA
jgi:GT2 family glycosyltransferase